MKLNEGVVDRVIRVILGIAIAVLGYFYLTDIWMWVAIIVGAILFITGLTGFCALYALFGMNTRSSAKSNT